MRSLTVLSAPRLGPQMVAAGLPHGSRVLADGQVGLSIETQVVAGLAVAIVVGLVSTWYQMRRRRARPFLVTQSFSREVAGVPVTIPLDFAVAERLSGSTYLSRYGAAAVQASDVAAAVRACEQLQLEGPQLLSGCAEVLAALDRAAANAELKSLLKTLLSMPFFNTFLMAAANGQAIADEDGLKRATELAARRFHEWENAGRHAASVPMFRDAEDRAYQFGFPGATLMVGYGLNKWQVANQQIAPFAQGIRFLDHDLLRIFSGRLAELLHVDIAVAQQTFQPLRELLEQHLHCVGRLYVANYGAEPMLIRASGRILVKGSGPGSQPLDIAATLGLVDASGQITLLRQGQLLPAGGEKSLVFVSKDREQDAVAQLRGMLAGSTCRARVVFECIKSTWPNRKPVKSRWLDSDFAIPGLHGSAARAAEAQGAEGRAAGT